MAASSSTELYSYAQSHIHTMHDDGAPSSEDGSGLHSPVFGAFPHAEPSSKFRRCYRIRFTHLIFASFQQIKSGINNLTIPSFRTIRL